MYCASSGILRAQNTDSLRALLNTEMHDTVRINVLLDLSEFEGGEHPDEALGWTTQALELSQLLDKERFNLRRHRFIARSYALMGQVEYYLAENVSGINHFKQATYHAKLSGDIKLTYNITANLGILLSEAGAYEEALQCYQSTLDHYRSIRDSAGMASVYINMGRIFKITGDYKTARHYYEKGIRLSQLLDQTDYVAYGNNNLGIVYLKEGKEIRKALHYFFEALKIEEASGDSLPMTNAMTNIGNSYEELDMLDSAEIWQLKSLALREILKDKQGVSANMVNLSHLYLKRKEFAKALAYGERGLLLALEMGLPEYEFNAHLNIANALHALGKDKAAFEHLESYIAIKDSVQSDEDLRKLTEMNVSYQYERQKLADSLAQVEKEKISTMQHEQELHRRSILLYSGSVIVALLFGLILFLVRGIRQKQKHNLLLAGKNELIQQQKEQVEEQKSLIEEKSREVTDSILYAKRLQQAILPPVENIRHYFPKSFLLYLPKDIVAGDFYFFETCADRIIIGVADCTGHGVPGALVSVVCSNALSRVVRENQITDPGKILDEARVHIVETFSKSLEQVRDGMDISLLSIDLKSGKALWSGANNPLWLQRQNGNWEEFSPDKQPVGLYEYHTPFTSHEFHVSKGDRIYLFSDGYADQFGGDSGKKLKPMAFRKCLQSSHEFGIAATEKSLLELFTIWKGGMEQIDDVCVLGIEIP